VACRYRLVYEVTTIRVPSYSAVSEDCDIPSTCCDSTSITAAICSDDELAVVDELDLCGLTWATSATIGFDTFTDLEVKVQTIQLPPGSSIVSTDCYTFECGDTISLDCDCD